MPATKTHPVRTIHEEWNVTTLMVGLKTITYAKISPKNDMNPRDIAGEAQKKKNGEPRRYSWGTQKKTNGEPQRYSWGTQNEEEW